MFWTCFHGPGRQGGRIGIRQLSGEDFVFPPPQTATEDGLLAFGGQVTPRTLGRAYRCGVFPWPLDRRMPMLWFNPDPRFVIELSGLHVSRSLRKVLRQQRFEIRFDSAFSRVVAACAAPRSDESGTWIDHRIAPAFVALHEMGGLDGVRAHSVEAWREGVLVGGLYGIAVGGVFSGESMFMRESNASKVALVALVERMIARGFTLLDCQVYTEHFESMGGIEVARAEYLSHLEAVVDHDCRLV